MIGRTLMALAGLALAAPALAAEAEHAAPSLFAGDLGNSFWTLLIFGLVLVVLGKYAWGPILNTLQTRESFIREALEKAKREREEAEERLRQYEERLAGARAEASAIVDEGRRDAEVVKRRIEEDARRQAELMIDRARREIRVATDTATKSLFTLSAKLATEMAARVLGRELTPQDHERLIAEGIQDLGGAEH
jgi:F-type H+-transporting ATPase subunit b